MLNLSFPRRCLRRASLFKKRPISRRLAAEALEQRAMLAAIQWTAASGGNGHWYELSPQSMTWDQAKGYAESRGGYLATIDSVAEQIFVQTLLSGNRAWLGAYQDTLDPSYTEPAGAWKWVTGEAWSYTNWNPAEPNNIGVPENYLEITGAGEWNDLYGTSPLPGVVESAAIQRFTDDFDPAVDAGFWQQIDLGTAGTQFTGSAGNALVFTGTGTRQALTRRFDLTAGGSISFALIIGNSSNGGENADAGENIVFEYTTDGINFTVIDTYLESGYSAFTPITEQIPLAAQTANTQFRWRQLRNSGSNFDQWAIDTISITGTVRAPTDVTLSPAQVPENSPIGTVVGTLSTTDPDVGDAFTYTLVAGTSDADNAAFSIVGNELRAAVSFDYEAKNSYTVRIRSTDQGGLFIEQPFTVSVTDVNEAVSFSFGFKHVNQAGADSYLVDSTGMRKYSEWQNPPITYWGPSANNAEGRLVYKFPFSMPTSSMRLLAHSPSWDFFNEPGGNGRGASALEVSKDGSTWISLRNSLEPRQWGVDWTYNEALPATVLGGNELWVRMRFYVESAPNSSYTDAQFGRSTSAATANVFEVQATFASNLSPQDIALSATSIAENAGANAVVGTLSTTDPDASTTFTYSLVAGTGSTDNAAFNISGNQLRATASLNFGLLSRICG